ncbi:phage tail tape measure protein [Paenibacillus campinasensis]|uniref:Phage tail tape measure protein n=1 Tax=Paenibacillus campinasensis TaxID=66347 RepID=A0A268EWV7_9BACL|nr:phage tail tape measure protein [Paenibacillus campinasensis]PAD77610.1 phage tail tape measure protein [Paenibacillus campinasensis]
MDNIIRFIESARRRLQAFRVLAGGLYGLMAGMGAALLLLVIGRIVPIPWLKTAVMMVPLAAILIGLLYGWLRRIPAEAAAQAMDRASGEAERSDMMVTALSFKEEDTVAARYQRAQAEAYGASFTAEMKSRLPAPNVRKQLLISMAGLVSVVALTLIPNPMDDKIEAAREQKAWVQEQVQKTEELEEQIQQETLDPATKQKLLEKLDELKQQLAAEQFPEQALEKLEEAMKEMEKLAKQQEERSRELAELARQMQQEQALAQTGQSLEQGKADEMQQEMSKMMEEVKQMTQQEKDELEEMLEQLAEAAKEVPDIEKLAEELKKTAQALQEGALPEELEEALRQMFAELEESALAKASADSESQGASALASALAAQGLGLAEQMLASGMSVSNSWSSGGSAQALAQAAGSSGESGESGEGGSGQPSGSEGSGSQGSGGSGSSGGSGGSGAGAGSGGSGTGVGNGTGGSGAGLGSGGRELVTTPRALEGSGNVEVDTGPLDGQGGEVQKGGVSPTVPGTARPYEEVYRDYEIEARKSLNRSQLPEQMQGLVEAYFIEINPNP